MTSGDFASAPIAELWVDRDKRQRREIVGIEDLKASISRVGLINPVVVDREHKIIAGERRYTACKQLGWTSIPVQYIDELPAIEVHLIEFEENVRRLDLPWQDQCNAVAEYHRLRQETDGADWTQSDTANALGMSAQEVGQKIDVAQELAAGNPRIVSAPKYSVARGIVARTNDRKKAAALETLASPEPEKEVTASPLIHTSFQEWAAAYSGPKFNFLHCDFPYGIDSDKHNQGGAAKMGGYSDSEELYWELIHTLAGAMETVVSPSAHLMFWFSMDYYSRTKEELEQMGWRVDPFPLIWFKSDNTGILPDPNRGGRRVYETAFLASRGDRKVVTPVANAFAAPTTKIIHPHEKSLPMLRHFFRMFVDDTTHILDPTAGSAGALRVATAMGAARVVGLEADPDFYDLAHNNFYKEIDYGDGQANS